MTLSRHPLNPAHQGDAFARLSALCESEDWVLGVATVGSRLSLRVYRPDQPWQGCGFTSGHENTAAQELLDRLGKTAA